MTDKPLWTLFQIVKKKTTTKKTKNSRTVHSKTLNNSLQYSVSFSFLCVRVCQSKIIAQSGTLRLSQMCFLSLHLLTSGPSPSELALVLSLMPAPFSEWEQACFNTQRREAGALCGANDVIKMLRVFPGWLSAMHMHVKSCYCAASPLAYQNATSCKALQQYWCVIPDCSRRERIERWERMRKKIRD